MDIETMQKIVDGAPDGATHFDGIDYWKNENNCWFIWFESNHAWVQIIEYKAFLDTFDVRPL